MNRIYFADKGHTRKEKCYPLWPVRDTRMMMLPEDFFSTPGLVCYINPKRIYNQYFISDFYIYAAENMVRRRYYDAHGFEGMPIMTGNLIKGYLSISSNIPKLLSGDIDQIDMSWGSRSMAIDLLRDAVNLFSQFFPVQE